MKRLKTRIKRPTVISFRLTKEQTNLLKMVFQRDAASGINSPNQLARKIVCDYLQNRLYYNNPAHKLQDVDLIGA